MLMRICKECGFPVTDDVRIARSQAVCCCIKPKIGLLAIFTQNYGGSPDSYKRMKKDQRKGFADYS